MNLTAQAPASAAVPSPHLIMKDDQFCIGRVRNVVVVIWNKPPSAAALDHVSGVARKAVAEHKKAALLLLVRGKGSPGADANKRAATLLQELSENLIGICSVNGGQDFWSKLTRVAMHSMAALATMNQAKFKFVATVPEAVDWLFSQNGVIGSKAELSEGLQGLVDSYPAP
jgi:hypothetical protein